MHEFLTYTNELWERYRSTGPGLPTIELPVGLDLLHKYQEELDAGEYVCVCVGGEGCGKVCWRDASACVVGSRGGDIVRWAWTCCTRTGRRRTRV